jgi:hypothetical protein
MRSFIKNIINLSLLLTVTACSNPVSPPVNKSYFPGPAANPFTVKVLSDSYIRRALDTYISTNNGASLVKDLKYYSISSPEQLTRVIQQVPNLCSPILGFAEVQNQLALVPSFENYMYIPCPPVDPSISVGITVIPAPSGISVQ